MLRLVRRSKAAARGAAAGYQVMIDAPGARYAAHRLVSPGGEVLTKSAYFGPSGPQSSDAWRDLPQGLIARDGYVEDYCTTETGQLAFFDEGDPHAIRQAAYNQGAIVNGWLALTADDLQRLMNGEAVLWCRETTAVVICGARIENL